MTYRPKDTCKSKVKGNIYYANWSEKKARVAIPTSDKIDFKTETVKKNKKTKNKSRDCNERQRKTLI